jgi:hypothetical protein
MTGSPVSALVRMFTRSSAPRKRRRNPHDRVCFLIRITNANAGRRAQKCCKNPLSDRTTPSVAASAADPASMNNQRHRDRGNYQAQRKTLDAVIPSGASNLSAIAARCFASLSMTGSTTSALISMSARSSSSRTWPTRPCHTFRDRIRPPPWKGWGTPAPYPSLREGWATRPHPLAPVVSASGVAWQLTREVD